jgi:hypothetical protein
MVVEVASENIYWKVDGKVRAKINGNGFSYIKGWKKIIMPFVQVMDKNTIFEFAA